MNRAPFVLLAALVAVTGCGIRRPLIRPADVPKYEADRARHRQELLENGGPSPFETPAPAPTAVPPAPPAQPAPLPPTQ